MAPKDWRSEIIKFPLEFAPSLSYSGLEHIRFSPGWGKKDAEDHFSYVFLWEIDQDPKLTSKKLEAELETYFDGLTHATPKSEIDTKTKAFFEKVNDSLFVGKILTYDSFTTKKEVNLNVKVSSSYCYNENKHLVLFHLSPQTLDHQIWKKMNTISIDLDCD
ncbi:hypothetical protein GCM10022258_09680 [Aquimarina gracilis]